MNRSQADLSLSQILEEAQHRWFRPIEVCAILMNHNIFKLEEEPPLKPKGGSFFLFDRKAVRYFRKDGHSWRKKKDGKTVKEAHERLKAGSKEVLHCYYAHGEENEHFQRRSYWLLERDMEHIVFVHYRDVKKDNKTQVSSNENIEGTSSQTPKITPSLPQVSRLASFEAFNQASSPSASEHSLPFLSPQYDGYDSNDDPEQSAISGHELLGRFYHASGIDSTSHIEDSAHAVDLTKSLTREKAGLSGSLTVLRNEETNTTLTRSCIPCQNPSIQDHSPIQSDQKTSLIEYFGTTPELMASFGTGNMLTGIGTVSQDKGNFHVQEKSSHIKDIGEQHQKDSLECINSEQVKHETLHQGPFVWMKSEASKSDDYQMQKFSQIFRDFQDDSHLQQEEQENLKKIDSFRRCMHQEIEVMGETPFFEVSLDSVKHFAKAFDERTVRSEDSAGKQQSMGLSLSLSRKQFYRILDFSPDHAFSTEETKVLITGEFLESLEDATECKWFCVFGNMEVPAELLLSGVFRTIAPSHAPGRVPLFISMGDGVACSNIREFCYLTSLEPLSKHFTSGENCLKLNKQETLFQIRFSMLLSEICQTHARKSIPGKSYMHATNADEWTQLEHASVFGDSVLSAIKENLIQQLLKEKLNDMQRSNALRKGELLLDRNGLGVLHMGAALGYDWVIGPLLSSGSVNINFRDARGWTALHWAANCGREKTVVALLAVGADPGVKTDPTPEFPAGQTPADLASRSGHKGIAGYLAESSLTGHLSTLTFWDGKNGKATDRSAVDTVSEKTSIKFGSVESEGQVTLQDSLAAMRNATQAAARIQFALRAFSFERRQEVDRSEQDEYGISDDELQYMLAAKKQLRNLPIARDEDLQSAAVRIQQKFRSWKGRRDFLLFRQRIVKIQAHVRGHQVRQQYKKITWSVGILEKAILRWRRKGKGLRGFHRGTHPASANDLQIYPSEDEDFLKAGRKQIEAGIEKALARVHSMVKSSEGREQYRRLLIGFELAKAHLDSGLLLEDSSFAADYTSCTSMSDM